MQKFKYYFYTTERLIKKLEMTQFKINFLILDDDKLQKLNREKLYIATELFRRVRKGLTKCVEKLTKLLSD